jgi:hypothetical protein
MMPAMTAHARTIVAGGAPAALVRLGFALQEDGSAHVGGLRLQTGGSPRCTRRRGCRSRRR